jgi:serine/threonine protein kinase
MTMDSARWHRIQELFHATVDLPAERWRTFLAEACPDAALAAEVLEMVEEDARGASILDRGPAEWASEVVGASATSWLGREIGPYRITGVLGEGGMGVVFRAERKDLESVVAIKILRDAWISTARRDRFAREQQLLAQLNHPSIAQLHDAGAFDDGTPYFVMEYVEGVSITAYCQAHGSTVAERLQLFRQACEAVQYAHGQLVIHRDLKPSNILVTAEGRVKLLDFGISKRVDGRARPLDETREGLHLMTPAYAAPEQLLAGHAGVDTDVYSLGVVLYELLVGRLPFDLAGPTQTEAIALLLAQEPHKPSAMVARSGAATPGLRRAAWADLDVLTTTAMHKDRARRYRTVEALLRDLDHYFKSEPLEARPDDWRYQTAKFVGRHRRPLAALAATVAAVAVLVTFYTVRLKRAKDAALAEVARTGRIERFMLQLFDGGDKDAAPKDGVLAVSLVARGVQEAKTFTGDPDLQADLYGTLGSMYQKLGSFSQAEGLLRAALEQRRALFGASSAQADKSLVDLGLLRRDQAVYDEAERLVRQGLTDAQRKLPATREDVARATTALGRVLEARGAYAQAIPVLEEAVRLHTAIAPETAEVAESVTELANNHFYLGHYDVSQALNERALALDRKLHGEQHPTVSSDLFNLGAIEADRAHFAAAEQLYRQGFAITEAWYPKDHYQVAADLKLLARVLIQEDRATEAKPLLERTLAIEEKVYPSEHPNIASTLNDLGNLAFDKNLGEAKKYYERELAIDRAVHHGDKHFVVGIALANLASVYLQEKSWSEAERLYRQALAVYVETLPADHVNAGITRIKLGRTLHREQREPEAVIESLAGYQIVAKQMKPSVGFLQKARQDLAEEYEALHEPEQAQKYRLELASTKP